MLIFDLSTFMDSNSKSYKLKELYNFRPIVNSPIECEGEGDTVLINYSFSKYGNCQNILPENQKLQKFISDKSHKLNPTSWVLFTRGSVAGIAAKISDLLFNRYHINNYDDFQIEVVSNTAIISIREDLNDVLNELFSDLLLRALFQTNHQHADDSSSFIVNILSEKSKKNNTGFFIKLGDVKDFTINLPSLEIQLQIIGEYQDILSRVGSSAELLTSNGEQMQTLVFDIQKSILI
jgi:hypothetical protein